jgi:hypothetical protein
VTVSRSRRPLAVLLLAAAVVWIGAALVVPRPVNPAVVPASTLEVQAAVPADVRALLRTSCFDCHSDETRWPWYSTTFPASWLLARDVREARGQLNFSRWSGYSVFERADLLEDVCIMTRAREMPLPHYRWLHPETRLSDAQVEVLCAWTHDEVARLMKGEE